MSSRRLPPGPRGTWLRGNLLEFRRDRLDFLTRCARDYGDLVGLRFGLRRLFLLNHPDLLEEVFVRHNHDFGKHFALRTNPLVFGKGLLTSEGDFWLRQRRLIQPAFTRARVAAYAAVMVGATENMLAGWKAGQSRDIFTEMMGLTLAIASKTLFDAEASAEAPEVGEALRELQENFVARFNSLWPLPIWVPIPQHLRLRRIIGRLDNIIFRFIRQRRQLGGQAPFSASAGDLRLPKKVPDPFDLLSLLLHAHDQDDGSRMSDKQVRDEAMTLFLAGQETTALALSWTWYLLSQHPQMEEKLLAEVDRVLGDNLPTAADLPRLTYTEQVILEAMRLYPPVYIMGREALRPCTIGGYRFPRGTTLLMCQWIVHRDPRFYERPEEFCPERWTPEFSRQLPHFAYFPFGGGPRICIGNHFAMLEMVLVLAAVARRFRFTLAPGALVVPWPTFTLRPQNGVPAVLHERSKKPIDTISDSPRQLVR